MGIFYRSGDFFILLLSVKAGHFFTGQASTIQQFFGTFQGENRHKKPFQGVRLVP